MTTQRLCSTIGCTSTATHLLTYTFPESRNEKEMDPVCRICGIGYTQRVSLKATLVEFTTEPKLDSWTVYASSGEYHVAARTLAEVANAFTADHPDDSMLAITCDAMEPALKLADEPPELDWVAKLELQPDCNHDAVAVHLGWCECGYAVPLPDWCETCGNEVRHGVCNCCSLRSLYGARVRDLDAPEDSISRAYDNGRRDERNGCGTE